MNVRHHLATLTLCLLALPLSARAQAVSATDWRFQPSPHLSVQRELRLERIELTAPRSLGILALGGIAAALSHHHEDPATMQRLIDRSSVEVIADAGNLYGSGWAIGGSSALALGTGALVGDRRLSAFGRDLMKSYLLSGAVAMMGKELIHRRRPTGGGHSFPSGHTTSAFCSVPVIFHHFGWQAGLPALVVATGTSLGRMEDLHHYLSDVIMGAAIGLAVGDAVVHRSLSNTMTASLVVLPDRLGVAVEF